MDELSFLRVYNSSLSTAQWTRICHILQKKREIKTHKNEKALFDIVYDPFFFIIFFI